MYDDLERAQRPSMLERFVLNTVIPSLLVTSFLHAHVVWTTSSRETPPGEEAVFFFEPVLEEPGVIVPETLPVLLRIPAPSYPRLLKAAQIEGEVILKAVVDRSGHVEPSSVGVVKTTDARLVPGAQEALLKAVFRPAVLNGRAVEGWVHVRFEFTLKNGTVSVR